MSGGVCGRSNSTPASRTTLPISPFAVCGRRRSSCSRTASPSCSAVIRPPVAWRWSPVFERNGGTTLFYGTYYEGLECSPNCFYFGAVPNQFLTGYVPWILENLGDVASISSDRTTSTPALPRRSFRNPSSRQPAAMILGRLRTSRSAQPSFGAAMAGQSRSEAAFCRSVEYGRRFDHRVLQTVPPTLASPRLKIFRSRRLSRRKSRCRRWGRCFAEGHYMTATYFQSPQQPGEHDYLSTPYRARWGDDAVTNVTVADTYQARLSIRESGVDQTWR